jgi:broad-specificity NMP kinase
MDNKNLDLELFVDRLLQEKKFPENLETEVMAQIKADLLDQVENRINAVIINNLSEDKLEEFNKKIDENLSDEEMQKFFSESIPDLPQLIASELIVFRQTYLS